jgi:hypothetical protein
MEDFFAWSFIVIHHHKRESIQSCLHENFFTSSGVKNFKERIERVEKLKRFHAKILLNGKVIGQSQNKNERVALKEAYIKSFRYLVNSGVLVLVKDRLYSACKAFTLKRTEDVETLLKPVIAQLGIHYDQLFVTCAGNLKETVLRACIHRKLTTKIIQSSGQIIIHTIGSRDFASIVKKLLRGERVKGFYLATHIKELPRWLRMLLP